MPRSLIYPALMIIVAAAVLDRLLARVSGFNDFTLSSLMVLAAVVFACGGRLLPQRQMARGYAYLAAFILGIMPAVIVLLGVPWTYRSHAVESLVLLIAASALGFTSLFRFIQRVRDLPAHVDQDADDG
ncbi:MAG: hypothetical protein RhofKO_34520 [Rhodothermales bacterium]